MSSARPLHFISGLPRSGSTLLSALLLQNPGLHAGIVSPLGSLVAAMLRETSQRGETSVFIDDRQRAALLRGLFEAYYSGLGPEIAVFDSNRSWTARADLLAELFPDCRIICCVRPVPWVIDSIERLIRRNRFELSKIFRFEPGGTVYSRAHKMMANNGLIGYPLDALKQAMHSEQAERLMLLPYDYLAEHPQQALDAIYDFCGLPRFTHDPANLRFDAREFDARLGTPGLHDVRPQVRRAERRSVLPPDLWAKWEGASVWRDPAFLRHGGAATRVAGPAGMATEVGAPGSGDGHGALQPSWAGRGRQSGPPRHGPIRVTFADALSKTSQETK